MLKAKSPELPTEIGEWKKSGREPSCLFVACAKFLQLNPHPLLNI